METQGALTCYFLIYLLRISVIFVQSIFSKNQTRILSLLSEEDLITDSFYLSGGTALAEFYLKHRFSTDREFVEGGEEVNASCFNLYYV